MTAFKLIIITVAAYLIGSINSAILVGRLTHGDDIRSHGSGNAGATNALRSYGKKAAAAVTIGDCLKAVISCVLAILMSPSEETRDIFLYLAGLGTVMGHNFPIYFGFKGGKGVLVSITVMFFADWRIALTVLILSLAVMAVTRYVSLGSVLGAVLFAAAALVFKHGDVPYIIFTVFIAALAVIRHKANIVRLINGTESKIGSSKV